MEFGNGQISDQLLHSAIANQHSLKSTLDTAVTKVDQLSEELHRKKEATVDGSSEVDGSTALIHLQVEELKKLISSMQDQWSNLDYLISQAVEKAHDNEQRMKRWNLLIHSEDGFDDYPTKQVRGKNVVVKGTEFSSYVVEKLNTLFPNRKTPLTIDQICCSHPLRLRDKKSTKKIVVVRFTRRDIKDELFYSKSSLKGTKYSISEHLTQYNQELLKLAKNVVGKGNAWSDQGMFFIKEGNRRVRVKSKSDFNRPHTRNYSNEHYTNNIPATTVSEHHAAINHTIAKFEANRLPTTPNAT